MFFFIIFFLSINNVLASRGCCSHHGGINICDDSGYWLCNDGSISSTCKCSYSNAEKHQDEQSTKENYEEKETVKIGGSTVTRKKQEKEPKKENWTCLFMIIGSISILIIYKIITKVLHKQI